MYPGINLTEKGQSSCGQNYKTLLEFINEGLKLYYAHGSRDSILSRCQLNPNGCKVHVISIKI